MMKKLSKRRLITIVCTVVVIFLIVISFGRSQKLITRTYEGESELWTIRLDYKGDYKFENNDEGQLTSSGHITHDIIVTYKGIETDLSEFQEVGVSTPFGGSGIGSDGGLTQDDLRFTGGGNQPEVLLLKNSNEFEVTIFWNDDEYHEESVWVYFSN